jgi:hypothetical protein
MKDIYNITEPSETSSEDTKVSEIYYIIMFMYTCKKHNETCQKCLKSGEYNKECEVVQSILYALWNYQNEIAYNSTPMYY